MSDPRLDSELTVDGTTYVLRFTHAALGLAEKQTGKTVPEIAMMVGMGRYGFHDLSCLTFAGLEGARRKMKLHHQPWTLEKVHELLDDADDFDAIGYPVVEAFNAALKKWFPDEYGQAEEAAEKLEAEESVPSGSGTDS